MGGRWRGFFIERRSEEGSFMVKLPSAFVVSCEALPSAAAAREAQDAHEREAGAGGGGEGRTRRALRRRDAGDVGAGVDQNVFGDDVAGEAGVVVVADAALGSEQDSREDGGSLVDQDGVTADGIAAQEVKEDVTSGNAV